MRASSAVQHEPAHVGPATSDRFRSGIESIETLFIGRVVETDGTPSARAVVVTSAGGQAVTEEDGSFRLHVQLFPRTSSIQVTAGRGLGSRFQGREHANREHAGRECPTASTQVASTHVASTAVATPPVGRTSPPARSRFT